MGRILRSERRNGAAGRTDFFERSRLAPNAELGETCAARPLATCFASSASPRATRRLRRGRIPTARSAPTPQLRFAQLVQRDETSSVRRICSPGGGFEFPLCCFASSLVECLSSPGGVFWAFRWTVSRRLAVGTAALDLVCSPCEGFELVWHYFAPPLVECLSSPGDGFRAVR